MEGLQQTILFASMLKNNHFNVQYLAIEKVTNIIKFIDNNINVVIDFITNNSNCYIALQYN